MNDDNKQGTLSFVRASGYSLGHNYGPGSDMYDLKLFCIKVTQVIFP